MSLDFTVKGVSDRDMDVRITSVTPNELYVIECQCACGAWNGQDLRPRDVTEPKDFMFQCPCGQEYGFALSPAQKGKNSDPVAFIR